MTITHLRLASKQTISLCLISLTYFLLFFPHLLSCMTVSDVSGLFRMIIAQLLSGMILVSQPDCRWFCPHVFWYPTRCAIPITMLAVLQRNHGRYAATWMVYIYRQHSFTDILGPIGDRENLCRKLKNRNLCYFCAWRSSKINEAAGVQYNCGNQTCLAEKSQQMDSSIENHRTISMFHCHVWLPDG